MRDCAHKQSMCTCIDWKNDDLTMQVNHLMNHFDFTDFELKYTTLEPEENRRLCKVGRCRICHKLYLIKRSNENDNCGYYAEHGEMGGVPDAIGYDTPCHARKFCTEEDAMPKKKPPTPVTRAKLLSAMRSIPDDASLWTGHAVNPDEDFTRGLCLNRSERMDKGRVLDAINASPFQVFPTIPGHSGYLLLEPRLYVWKDSINQSQRFPVTPGTEHYTHVVDKCNPYYDIFFLLDRERKTITFALGHMKKEIPVVEGTEWCWKPTKKGILCQSMDRLEKNFLDPFWNSVAVHVGRKVLGVKPII